MVFLYNQPYEVSGDVHYENYNTGISQMVSGLKMVNAPTHLTGAVWFRLAKRDRKVLSSKEGRVTVDRLVAQFGWDEIDQLETKNIYLDIGKFKLEYGGITYRLVDKNDFGQNIDRNFNTLGVIEATFERERKNS